MIDTFVMLFSAMLVVLWDMDWPGFITATALVILLAAVAFFLKK